MTKVEEIFFHLMIIVVALLAGKKFTYEFSVPKYAALATIFGIMLLILLPKLIKRKKLDIYISFANLSWLLFAVASFVSIVYVLLENSYYVLYSTNVAFFILLTVILSIYISNRFFSKETITKAMLTFVGTGVVIAIDSLLAYYVGRSIFLGRFDQRFSKMNILGTIGNPIFVANYMTMLLPIAFYFVFADDYGWKNKGKIAKLTTKIFCFVAFLLFLTVDLLCQTRSEYIAMFLSFAAFWILYFAYSRNKKVDDEKENQSNKRLRRILTALLAICSLVVFWLFGTNNPLTQGKAIAPRFTPEVIAADADTRILAWLAAVEQWKESKVIGTGIGTYQIKAIDMMEKVMREKPKYLYAWENFKRAHNDYVQVLGETGIFGFSSVILLAVALIFYAFAYMRRETSKDNLFLFLSLSSSFIAFMVQSFFSFPGQLMPNALLAIFVASVAVGRYFNRWFVLAKNVDLSGFKKFTAVVLAFFVVIFSIYFTWNYFLSEYNFKWGEYSFKMIEALSKQKSQLQEYEKLYAQKFKELESLSGEFARLRPENYPVKGIEGERQRLLEIANIRASLQKSLETIRKNIVEIDEKILEHENKARERFIKSVKINHTYGKSHFYLSSLALRSSRIEKIQKVLESGNYLPLEQRFDDIQKVIFPDYRSADLLFLSEFASSYSETIALLQAALDSCDLFKTSLKSFNERNTYKALAMRYAAIYILLDQLESKLVENGMPFDRNNFSKLKDQIVLEFENFARKTIEKLPGAWNKYPDWKNIDYARAFSGEDIYRVVAKSAEDTGDKRLNEFIVWVAEKEIWACENMAKKGVWAVPNGAIDSICVLIGRIMREDEKRGKEFVENVLGMYKSSYERLKVDLQKIQVEKAVEQYIDQVKDGVVKILNDLKVDKNRILTIETSIKRLEGELRRLLSSLDWKIVARYEVNFLIKDGQHRKKVLLSNYLSDEIRRHIEEITGKIVTDQTTLAKFKENLSGVVKNIPFDLLLWERINRFISYYDVLAEYFE
ncbi:O-antigen ligase family protein [Pseudothermotoga thermarum]|uniref:O-antigen polymerase n=1 Tax=Pseudothermotoga thermarum DSM 5069 TaxID=688269 RepID=F7YXQ8_9THEM|nr:O-antigen ligase family protein [Pseudothermotoga thermarum]AEH50702.1 O-antigen polymerase [Pseudothermotoga thermarum DSM 5069]